MSSARRQSLFLYRNPPGLRGRNIFVVQLWYIVRGTLFHLSPRVANRWRASLLRLFGAKIGKSVIIRPSVRVEFPWKLSIGDYSWVGEDVRLYSLGRIAIGANAVISQESYLCTGGHDYASPTFDMIVSEIIIEDECWVAADVFIAPGVTIPAGSVVGSRSSVFKSPVVSGLYAGSPAMLMKRFEL